jgi:hypothetical protein
MSRSYTCSPPWSLHGGSGTAFALLATFHKITEFYTEWCNVYPNITSKFRTIAMFKRFVKQSNVSYKTGVCVLVLSQHSRKDTENVKHGS